MKKIAIINRQAPFNTADARESMDMALIFAAYDQQVTVIFIDDGVYQLLDGQNAELVDGKDFLATMKTFELYDIEQIIVCRQSLQQRGLGETKLFLPAEQQSKSQIATLLSTFDHVITV